MIELSIRHSLRDLDIDIRFTSEARCLALFGDSGAGKTTILNAIAGLLRPAQGRIVLNGQVLFDSENAINVKSAMCSRTAACFRTSAFAQTCSMARSHDAACLPSLVA
jgi:ABC-type molybdate transport system ATPase subunit